MRKGRPKAMPLAQRFWEMVNKDGPMPDEQATRVHPEIKGERCWLYGRGRGPKPMVHVQLDGSWKGKPASVVAWFLETGRWPEYACHKCDRPRCVRYSHLFEANHDANMRDMLAKGRNVPGMGGAKLTATDAEQIRREGMPWVRSKMRHRRSMVVLVRRIARRYRVGVDNITAILRNETWRKP